LGFGAGCWSLGFGVWGLHKKVMGWGPLSLALSQVEVEAGIDELEASPPSSLSFLSLTLSLSRSLSLAGLWAGVDVEVEAGIDE